MNELYRGSVNVTSMAGDVTVIHNPDYFIELSAIGPQGVRGNGWTNGPGAPTEDGELPGDMHLNNSNGDIYTWNGAAWTLVGNLKGPTGATGATGPSLGAIISDTEPIASVHGNMWWQSNSGIFWIRYQDLDSNQWIQTNSSGQPPPEGGGGGGIPEAPFDGQQYARQNAAWSVVAATGGGGDDLETTSVAAFGSSIEQTIPRWLAGAPVLEIAGELFVGNNHRGVWVHLMNAVGTVIYLPGDWLPGWAFGARQVGTGIVSWVTVSGASLQVPFTKIDHTTILEQYEEVVFRVISNSDGAHAVWGFSGATG